MKAQHNRAYWPLTDRQDRIPWWNQRRVSDSSILLVGAGGLGSNLAKILIQMGVGRIELIDPDLVEDSNRNRQLFVLRDVGKPKAHRVLRNIKPYAIHSSQLRGHFSRFEDWASAQDRTPFDVICCGVDSVATMMSVALHGLMEQTPVVFINVSKDAEACRVFIQRPEENAPCFACYQPDAFDNPSEQSCLPVPAVADILQVAVGFAARATVGELLGVPIGDYNCRDITFTGFDIRKSIPKRTECRLCMDRRHRNA